MLTGTLVKKGDGTFVLKVEKVMKVWKNNRASNPKSAVGRELFIDIWKKSRLAEEHAKVLRGLEVGDRVDVEPFHMEGDHLSVVEWLKKVD